MKAKLTARDVERLVAAHFDFRRNIIVPNVSWGLHLGHEADLVVLRPSGWAEEVEVKVAAGDIVADTRKRKWMLDGGKYGVHSFRRMWFALPERLAGHKAIPAHAGILAVVQDENLRPYIRQIRPAKVEKRAIRWDQDMRMKLCELATMRIWVLKHHLANFQRCHDGRLLADLKRLRNEAKREYYAADGYSRELAGLMSMVEGLLA